MNNYFPIMVTPFLAQDASMVVEDTSRHFLNLNTPAIIFIIVAFLVVAKMISKHFEGRQQLALKRLELSKDDAAGQPAFVAKQSTGTSILVKLLIVFFLGFLLLCIISTVLFIGVRATKVKQIEHHASTARVTRGHSLATSAELYPSDYLDAISKSKSTRRNTVDPVEQHQRIEGWKETLLFPANQYSGVESCATPLARMIHEILDFAKKPAEKNEDVSTQQTLVVDVEKIKAAGHATFFKKFKAAFKGLNPDVKILEAGKASTPDKDVASKGKPLQVYEANLNLKVKKTFSGLLNGRPSKLEQGEVICLLNPEGSDEKKQQKTFILNFDEYPWLNDFKTFARFYPSKKFTTGLSQSLEESAAAAHKIAIQDAANQLSLPVEIVEQLVLGTFKQTIIRSYGNVYREAVLVDAKKELAFQKWAAEIDTRESAARASNGKSLKIDPESGLAILAIMTAGLAFIANIATQGYYRTGLSRTAVIVSSLAAFFIILLVILNFA